MDYTVRLKHRGRPTTDIELEFEGALSIGVQLTFNDVHFRIEEIYIEAREVFPGVFKGITPYVIAKEL